MGSDPTIQDRLSAPACELRTILAAKETGPEALVSSTGDSRAAAAGATKESCPAGPVYTSHFGRADHRGHDPTKD